MNALDELIQAGGDIHRYFTDAEIDAARTYEVPLYWKAWIDTGVYWLQLSLFLGLGWNRRLLAACERAAARWLPTEGTLFRLSKVMDRVWKGPGWFGAVLFILAFLLTSAAIDLPEGIYFGHFREKALGLTNQGLLGFLKDAAIGLAIAVSAQLACVFCMYALMRLLGNKWWWVLGVPVTLWMMAMAGRYDGAQARLLYESHELEAGPLRDQVAAVMTKAQVEYGKILIINSSRTTNRGNAYVAGEGSTREIVIFDSMLKNFSNEEIAIAVAHEVGHIRENAQLRLIVSALLMVPLLFFFHLLLTWGARSGRFGFDEPAQVSGMPLLIFAWSLLTFAVHPVTNTYQRDREADADYYALQLTNDPEHLRTLMVKLGKENKVDPAPPGWKEFMYASHPAVARRLAMAYRFEKDPATAR
jgi:STE24 endopeptidase